MCAGEFLKIHQFETYAGISDLPWATLPNCDARRLITSAQLYETYSDNAVLSQQPAPLTIIGWEQPRTFDPGLYTSLHDILGAQVLCNFLQLSPTYSLGAPPLYIQQSISMKGEEGQSFHRGTIY